MTSSNPVKTKSYATSLFGEDGMETFKVVALTALKQQKIQSDIQQQSEEIIFLRNENEKLKKQNKDLQISLFANIEDRERVILHKNNELNEIEKDKKNQEKVHLIEKEEMESKFFFQLDELKQERDRLIIKINQLEKYLNELIDFKETKDRMNTIIIKLESEKHQIKIEHSEEIRLIEQKMINDSDKMKQEKLMEISACKLEMQKMMQDRLDRTTKRTMEENNRMSCELGYQSSKLEKIIQENDILRNEKKIFKQDIHILKGMTEELSKKVKFYEKLFRKMQLREENNIIKKEEKKNKNQFKSIINDSNKIEIENHDNHDNQLNNSILINDKNNKKIELFDLSDQSINDTSTFSLSLATEALTNYLDERKKNRNALDIAIHYNQHIDDNDLNTNKVENNDQTTKMISTSLRLNHRVKSNANIKLNKEIVHPRIKSTKSTTYMTKNRNLNIQSVSHDKDISLPQIFNVLPHSEILKDKYDAEISDIWRTDNEDLHQRMVKTARI